MRTSRHTGEHPRSRRHHDEESGRPEGGSRRGHRHGGGPDGRTERPERGRGTRGGPRGGRGRRGRMARGDVRTAILLLLAEEPMHGYQLMQAISDRTRGRWAPSPGAIYPAINLLEDEGLVTVTADAGRKVARLTAAGTEHVEAMRESVPDPFAESAESEGPDLRSAIHELLDATRQVGRAGSDEQIKAAATILSDARRSMYLLLANGTEARVD